MVEVEKDLSLKFSGHCFFFCGISSLCVCIVNISPFIRQVSKLSMTVKLMTSH